MIAKSWLISWSSHSFPISYSPFLILIYFFWYLELVSKELGRAYLYINYLLYYGVGKTGGVSAPLLQVIIVKSFSKLAK